MGYDRVRNTISRRQWKYERKKIFERQGWLVDDINSHPDCPHGTVKAYQYWWCKCEECRAANRAQAQERRARNIELYGKAEPFRTWW